MKSPVTLENFKPLAASEELEAHRNIVQQHIDSFPSRSTYPDRSAALILFPDFFEFNGHVIQAKADYGREDEATHDNIPFNKEFVLTRMETDVDLGHPLQECKICVLNKTSGCKFALVPLLELREAILFFAASSPAQRKQPRKNTFPIALRTSISPKKTGSRSKQ